MHDNQWQFDMISGIAAAAWTGEIKTLEVDALSKSIQEPIDEKRMEADTARRLAAGGA
jgi:hypothetical protein